MILAQWQNAVTRRDMSKEFTFNEIKQVCAHEKSVLFYINKIIFNCELL